MKHLKTWIISLLFAISITSIPMIQNTPIAAGCGCTNTLYGFPFPYMTQKTEQTEKLACNFGGCKHEYNRIYPVYFYLDVFVWTIGVLITITAVTKVTSKTTSSR